MALCIKVIIRASDSLSEPPIHLVTYGPSTNVFTLLLLFYYRVKNLTFIHTLNQQQ